MKTDHLAGCFLKQKKEGAMCDCCILVDGREVESFEIRPLLTSGDDEVKDVSGSVCRGHGQCGKECVQCKCEK